MYINNVTRNLNICETPSINEIRGNMGSSEGSVQHLQYKLSQALEDAGKHFDHVVTAVRGNNQCGELQNFKNKIANMDESQGTANNFRLQDYMSDYSRMQTMLSNMLKKISDDGDSISQNLK